MLQRNTIFVGNTSRMFLIILNHHYHVYAILLGFWTRPIDQSSKPVFGCYSVWLTGLFGLDCVVIVSTFALALYGEFKAFPHSGRVQQKCRSGLKNIRIEAFTSSRLDFIIRMTNHSRVAMVTPLLYSPPHPPRLSHSKRRSLNYLCCWFLVILV